jgi:hypothetical protein
MLGRARPPGSGRPHGAIPAACLLPLILCATAAGSACGARAESPGGANPSPFAGAEPDAAVADGAPGEAAAASPAEAAAMPAPPDGPGPGGEGSPDPLSGDLGGDGDCSPDPRREHCVLLEPLHAGEARAAALAERLTAEGLRASAEGGQVALTMDEDAILRVFGARVDYRSRATSAGIGFACEAELSGGRVPEAWRDDVRGFGIGHQICE